MINRGRGVNFGVLGDFLGDTDIGNINKRIAGKYVSYLIQSKNPAGNTLSNITSDIGSLFRWAEARGYIEQNPFNNLHLPKSKKNVQSRRPWSNEEIINFSDSLFDIIDSHNKFNKQIINFWRFIS